MFTTDDRVAVQQRGRVRIERRPERAIEDGDPQVGLGGARPRSAHTLTFYPLIAVAQPGGIGEQHAKAAQVHGHLDDVPGGSGSGVDDRRFTPGKRVQQARLAGVRWPDDGDRDTVADTLTPARVSEVRP